MSEETPTPTTAVAVTIEHGLPERVVALDAAVVAEAQELTDGLIALMGSGLAPAEFLPRANALIQRAVKLEKDVKASKQGIKRPINNLLQRLDDAANEALEPLVRAQKAILPVVAGYEKTERERIERENAAAREAYEEQMRLYRQQQEQAKLLETAAKQAEQAAKSTGFFADLLDETPAVAPSPEVLATPAPVLPPPPPKPVEQTLAKTATVRRTPVVTVLEPKYILRHATKPDGTTWLDDDGKPIALMVPDEKALARAMQLGLVVNWGEKVGATLHYEETHVRVGQRAGK